MNSSFASEDNLLSFTRSLPGDHGRTVLNLVLNAAELFSGMEEQVRAAEARAQSVCKSATERAQIAEKRLGVAERAGLEVINEADRKLQDATKALMSAEARIAATEDKVTALEFRAQSAEALLREAKRELLLVEEAIRKRLLSEKPSTV
jgi:hypothetical protein